ncbi:hypothetical protein Acr_00g0030090 [Actinidia rufa]|uniref:Uncharacterized protein n=1 Tax=Actinidia rufa TaxID=165716 RepID=A0A7J0DEQ5_9ERIC|nr:hypothetical protein Acr_00g0030090 [Actinidia rufa]
MPSIKCVVKIYLRPSSVWRPSPLAHCHGSTVHLDVHIYVSFIFFLAPTLSVVLGQFLFSDRDGSASPSRPDLAGLLLTISRVNLASCLYKHSMVMSRLSVPPGSNRPGFFPKVALAALCASSSSLPSLCPTVLGV